MESDPNVLPEKPIYFMTDDDVTRGQHQVNPLGQPYPAVIQPNRVETVITPLHRQGRKKYWKLSRYFGDEAPGTDEFELYNLTDDPLETLNLANSAFATPETRRIQDWMMRVLEEQRKQKRLFPVHTGLEE
jgi:hypothetical protein